MSIKFLSLTLLIILTFHLGIAQTNARFYGKVIDKGSQEPLSSVNIDIKQLDKGTTTNEDGEYEFQAIEPGIYTVKYSYVGYKTHYETDLVIKRNRPKKLDVSLSKKSIEMEAVTVTDGYFSDDPLEKISRIEMSTEEIRRSAGSGGQLNRVAKTLPGVASGGESSQDLMVRGGSPFENGFYIDNIPVPTIKHFEMQNGASNGPIGIINTDLVTKTEFMTGGFSPLYGNHLSSVMDISYREGSRENIQGRIGFDMSGINADLEMPIDNGRGSILISGNRSYLDLIADAFNSGVAPRYADLQGKATYDITDDQKLTLLNIYGSSDANTAIEEAEDAGQRTYFESATRQNTAGLNLHSRWSSKFYSQTSFSHSYKNEQTTFRYTENESKETEVDATRQALHLRNVNFLKIDRQNRLQFGLEAKRKTGDYSFFLAGQKEASGYFNPERNIDDWISGYRATLFGNWVYEPTDRINLNAGSRVTYNTMNEESAFSPRASISFDLTDNLTADLAGGLYHQQVPYFYVSQRSEFEDLSDLQTTHAVAGLTYYFNKSTRLTLEAYDKQYSQVPIQPSNVEDPHPGYVVDQLNRYEQLESTGESYARGIDLMFQKKLVEGFYGHLSTSFFRSRYKDVNGEWRNREFDVKTLVNVTGGYKPNDNWDFSIRWSYLGDKPYTPIDQKASAAANRTVLNMNQFNENRMPAHHSLYLRAERRVFFENLTMTTFLEVWNAYNRSNVEGYYWHIQDQKVAEQEQFSLLPVGGVEFEF